MTFQIDNADVEKVVLVAAQPRGSHPLLSMHESLAELTLLADTAGLSVAGQLTQNMTRIDPATYIGSGKVGEVVELLNETGAKTVIFDDELSPRHQRELSEILGINVKLLDRSALILDIFAQHARTREGALQVELAQYEYRLPRLTRQWTHLARQAGGGAARGGSGGVGVRGPGETQLEVDRREISKKITKLKEELEKVRQHRSLHRKQRQKSGVPLVALLGYTNAGKSTLLKALSGADIYIADQLFATLDPTTRRVELPSGRQVLFSDTVGFIQKLPPALIAAFRATLEEILEADVVLHMVDTTNPHVTAHIEAVEDILAEIEMPQVPRILVWNKIDAWGEQFLPPLPEDDRIYAAQVKISAQNHIGIEKLLQVVEEVCATSLPRRRLTIPYERGDLVAQLYELARVINRENTSEGVVLNVELPVYLLERFEVYGTHA